jgi:hypothetical protein
MRRIEDLMRTQFNSRSLVREVKTIKISVTMPADMVAALKVAGFQRRSLGELNVGVSGLVREAVEDWLDREINNSSLISVQIQ